MLDKQMSRDVDTLASAVAARDVTEAHQAALRVAQDDLDLRLRHQPVTAIDRARLDLWARQILVDAADDDPGAVAGDVTTLGWTWDRVRHTADPAGGGRFDAQLRGVRSAAEKKDVAATARATPALLATISALKIG